MKITTMKTFLCIILMTAIAGTAIITIPNHDLVNHNLATNDSVKSTADGAIINKAVTNIVITSLTTTKPTSIQPTTIATIATTEPYTKETIKETNSVIKSTEHIEQVYIESITEESEYKQNEEIENNFDTLLSIDNPDFNYSPAKIELSSTEREEIACIVMGEFGSGGFIGCALIAQAIRDAMITYGHDGYNIRSNMQYYGYDSSPTSTVYEAVDWIFDGNAVVQHRILVMNNSDGGWHSTQDFVVYYQGVWFYDM